MNESKQTNPVGDAVLISGRREFIQHSIGALSALMLPAVTFAQSPTGDKASPALARPSPAPYPIEPEVKTTVDRMISFPGELRGLAANQLDDHIDIVALAQDDHVIFPDIGAQVDAALLAAIARADRGDLDRPPGAPRDQRRIGLDQANDAGTNGAKPSQGNTQGGGFGRICHDAHFRLRGLAGHRVKGQSQGKPKIKASRV